MAKVEDYLVFSNPPMAYARANMSLALSTSGGKTWDYRSGLFSSLIIQIYEVVFRKTLNKNVLLIPIVIEPFTNRGHNNII